MSIIRKDNGGGAIAAVDRNIAAVHRVRANSDENRRKDQKLVDDVAVFAGSTSSLYLHFGIYGVLLCNHFFASGALRMHASIENISLAASLEAIFLAIFVLINQRRMNIVERKSSDLHLQMSLLAEHEITRVAQVVDLVAKHFGVNTAGVNDLEEIKKDVDPDEILERISSHEAAATEDKGDET